MAAVAAQAERFTHTAFQVMAYEPYVRLAERLNALAPFKGPAKTVFFTTGAEAVENAVKIARAATGRSGVIAFTGGFHGRTMMTMALTGKVLPYKKGFGPMPGDVYHVPFPIDAARRHGRRFAQGAVDYLFKADIEPERVAAIIIEPVQGEGGFHVAPTELLVELRRICDEHGILLIADEVQTGFARTGKLFAIEHSGRRARPHHHGQVAGRRLPAVGRDRPGRDHGRGRSPAASAAPMPARRSPAPRPWPCST